MVREQPPTPSPRPLTFDHNNVCLWADPLDFGRLLQLIAVGVVGGTTLVGARVVEAEFSEVDGARGVCEVRGVHLHAVVPCTVKQLSKGLVGLMALYEPPLHLGERGAHHLTVQLSQARDDLCLGQGTLDEARCAPWSVSQAHRESLCFCGLCSNIGFGWVNG